MRNKENFNILVVDDEQAYRDVLEMILTEKKNQVACCANGKEALDILAQKSFDLVITDLRLPVMDGRMLLDEIKKKKYDTEVIMLTAHGTIEDAVEAMKVGAYTYVTKGRDPEELLIEIKKIKETKRIRQENEILKGKMQNHYMLDSNNYAYRHMLSLAKRAAMSESICRYA